MTMYYNDINTTPLEVFRLVMDTNDFKHLLIEGEYKEEDAVKAWMLLYDAYNENVKSRTNNVQFRLKMQAYILAGEYQICNNCLFAIIELNNCNLINFEDKFDLTYFIKTINEYGFKFDPEKKITDEVERIIKQLRNKKTQIEQINKRIESYNTGEKRTLAETIGKVEKYLGFQINEHNTMVSKFIVYLNLMIAETQNKKKDGKRN